MLSALSFTSPLILAALAALPAIWWLLRATPPSPKTVRFPAFIILRQLKTSEETPDRTPWWLLLLRLLLAAFVILGLAGPILNAPPPAPGAGPIMLVIDDTWAAAAHWRVRRDLMETTAAEAAQNDREIFIVTTAPQRVPPEIAPITGEEMRGVAANLAPAPLAADRASAIERLVAFQETLPGADLEVRWLSDGVTSAADAKFLEALREIGAVTVFADPRAHVLMLQEAEPQEDGPAYRIERLSKTGAWEGDLVATARDGREIARLPVAMKDGERTIDATLSLPLALRNELSAVRIENALSAGGVQLIDARDRRALVGLVSNADQGRDSLLSGTHYLREALNPYAEILTGPLDELLRSDVSVIVLDDVGTLRTSDNDTLTAWVERGGVLIRFAGPILAEAAQDRTPALLPVPLRGGGRAFGGALTWDTPQRLDEFPAEGPFGGLVAAEDVLIRRQVLAQPGGETTERTWARLQDGTPLVTGERRGNGAIALFHITATPQWSDLPVSEMFIQMLRRLTFLSALGPETADASVETRFAPLRLMDGYGRLRPPADDDPALTAAELAEAPGPNRHPGLYGAGDAPLALNAVNADTRLEPLNVPGALTLPYTAEPPQRLSAPLFAIALAMLLLDGLVTLWISGRLRLRGASAAAAIIVTMMTAALTLPNDAVAQPLDAEIDVTAIDAALETRLAFVKTGDPAVDDLSAQALTALSRELYRRTSIEPAPPTMVNLETDDLSLYPFLYWPIVPGAEAPSDETLANVENFMRFGGLILFDTRDDERAVGAGSTPEAQALQRILTQLDIPPLTRVEGEHVLLRSFYLMGDLQGRLRNTPVWVQADASAAADGVTPLIIGGRDWAGAWATDDLGRPLRPMPRGGERARELAYRAGVNMVMVAFTGNYKSDQVHTPILLERLGQ
ncbi:MAG: DUF4159 domain-containing protein [Pseudomonadota bacterium]